MISTQEQLQNRGYLKDGIESDYRDISCDKKYKLLESTIATERTLGARLLKQNKTKATVTILIKALKAEKKLYSKIEISSTLSELGEIAIIPLIMNLGKIGNNQHKKIPEKQFLKDSYPLPRDLASRTLVRIGEKALPELLKRLETVNKKVFSELIDAIGHINFNSKTSNIYKPLKDCYNQNETDDLIKWKIIRAMSGTRQSKTFLNEQYNRVQNERLKKEINRSLRIIKNKES
jgi:HEAT repeat protein